MKIFSAVSSPTDKICISLFEFLKLDMNHKLIYSIKIPKLTSQQVYRSYKVFIAIKMMKII